MGGHVEVVHVAVRHEDDVEWGERLERDAGRDQPLRENESRGVDADAAGRVGGHARTRGCRRREHQ